MTSGPIPLKAIRDGRMPMGYQHLVTPHENSVVSLITPGHIPRRECPGQLRPALDRALRISPKP